MVFDLILDHISNMIIFVINYHGVSLCDILVLYESINKCPKGSLCTYNQACWNIIFLSLKVYDLKTLP